MKIKPASSLHGSISIPGDKSISHRAIMLGSLAEGTSVIQNFLMGEDCLSTIACFQKMGVSIEVHPNQVVVHGVGLYGLHAPADVLYTGNSGTTTRLLAGILAGQNFNSTLTGDASIQKRPMKRIITPLTKMGASIQGVKENYCPLSIFGKKLHGIKYTLPVASAQLKSSILLAGLYADTPTTVMEPVPTRDHTERMLMHMGVNLDVQDNQITMNPPQKLQAQHIFVPSDISSAAFFMVAGCILPNSCITLRNVGINPTRTGIIDVLREMGANITLSNIQDDAEPRCDITVSSSQLHGVTIKGDVIPRLIDEIPILAVAGAFAKGETIIADAEELKVKESNRILAMTTELTRAGADVIETPDGMKIRGGQPLRGTIFQTYHDHRIAMSMAICALGCSGESIIENDEVVSISYPSFFDTLRQLGGVL